MGHQIIRQPDGLYAVFSSSTDSWILYDATRKAYAQFAMTFEEANAESVKHGGEDLGSKLSPRLRHSYPDPVFYCGPGSGDAEVRWLAGAAYRTGSRW